MATPPKVKIRPTTIQMVNSSLKNTTAKIVAKTGINNLNDEAVAEPMYLTEEFQITNGKAVAKIPIRTSQRYCSGGK